MELHMDEDAANDVTVTGVITDAGRIQTALAGILPADVRFYVDAERLKNEARSQYFIYKDTDGSNAPLYHKTTSSSSGDCLTFTSSGLTISSAGNDCQEKLFPLCFRETGASDLAFVNKQCGNCDDVEVD